VKIITEQSTGVTNKCILNLFTTTR